MKKMYLCLAIFSIVFSGCENNTLEIPEIETQTKSADSELKKKPLFAAHRCNSLLKIKEAIDAGITSYEIDIHVEKRNGKSIMFMGHEAATSTGKTFTEYMDSLYLMNPDFEYLWLDFKDLNSSENENIIHETLTELDEKYALKDRVLIESRYPLYLQRFSEEGWPVSYYIQWDKFYNKTENEKREAASEILNKLSQLNLHAISFDARVNKSIEKYFLQENIILYNWDLSIVYGKSDFEEQAIIYENVNVVLFTFPSNNNI